MSRGSNRSIKRCPSTTTSDCVEWVGEDIPCLDICYGDTLTDLENAIATKLCELAEDTDVSDIALPDCFVTAFGSQDENVHNLLVFLLDTACNQQKSIENLTSLLATNNPSFTLDYPCCSDICIEGTTLTVSNHLQKIILCLCEQSSRLDTLENTVIPNLEEKAQLALDTANNALSAVASWTASKSCILASTGC